MKFTTMWLLTFILNGQPVTEPYSSLLECSAAQTRLLGQIVQAKAKGELNQKDYEDRLNAVTNATCEQSK